MDNLTNLASGGGGAFVGAILTFLGFKSRVDRVEKSSDDAHKRIDDVIDGLPLNFVGAAHHITCQGATVKRLDQLNERVGKMEEQGCEQIALLHEIKGKLEGKNA